MFAGYKFKNRDLYELARTHTSYANEQKKRQSSNQRLEFLGDSILGLIAGEYIYNNYPHLPEGSLTKIRADVVCEKSLYEIAKEIKLGDCLLLGKGEEICGGRDRASNLADAFEAMLGAVYLDSDLNTVKRILIPLIKNKIDEASKSEGRFDYKTTLQEIVQRNKSCEIKYVVTNVTGPDHLRVYTTQVLINGKASGKGTGGSKKESQQSAAKNALEKMAVRKNETL